MSPPLCTEGGEIITGIVPYWAHCQEKLSGVTLNNRWCKLLIMGNFTTKLGHPLCFKVKTVFVMFFFCRI